MVIGEMIAVEVWQGGAVEVDTWGIERGSSRERLLALLVQVRLELIRKLLMRGDSAVAEVEVASTEVVVKVVVEEEEAEEDPVAVVSRGNLEWGATTAV
jgi:hypothetical protein